MPQISAFITTTKQVSNHDKLHIYVLNIYHLEVEVKRINCRQLTKPFDLGDNM